MSEVVRRRALLIEVGVLVLWRCVPAWTSGISPNRTRPWLTLASSLQILASSVGAIALIAFIIWNSGDAWSAFGLRRPKLVDLLIGVAMAAVVYGAFFLPPRIAMAKPLWPTFRIFALQGAGPTIVALIAIVAAASFEELFYRGLLISRLTELTGNRWMAVCIAAALFASVHIYEGLAGLYQALAVGLLLGISFVATKRLWPGVVAHVLINVCVMLLRYSSSRA